MSGKYERAINELKDAGTTQMKVFGQSMRPIIDSGSLLTFRVEKSYRKEDIVFCKVKGRFIDAHKITKVDDRKGYMIANNHGYENGWTKTIYGRVIGIDPPSELKKKV